MNDVNTSRFHRSITHPEGVNSLVGHKVAKFPSIGQGYLC